MARDFESGSSEYIELGIGDLDYTGSTGITLAALVNPESTGGTKALVSLNSAGPTVRARLDLSTTNVLRFISSATRTGTTALTNGTWYLVAVTKAGGSATPRFHILALAAGTWVHEAGSGAAGNWTTPGGTGVVYLGRQGTTNYHDGCMALVGAWKRALSDAEVERLAGGLRAWLAQQPDGLWPLNQDAVATKVVDWTGGGANQTAISGTTVATSHPPRWRWGGAVRAVRRPATSSGAYSQAIDTAVAASAALARLLALGRTLAPSAGTTAALARSAALGRALSATAASAATLRKASAKTLGVSAATIATLVAGLTRLVTLTATAATAATFGRALALARTLAPSAATTATLARLPHKVLAVAAGTAPILARGLALVRGFFVGVQASPRHPIWALAFGRRLDATAGTTTRLQRALDLTRATLTAAGATATTLTKLPHKVLTLTAGTLPGLAQMTARAITLTAQAVASASLGRALALARTLATSAPSAASLAKGTYRTLTATAGSAATLVATYARFVFLRGRAGGSGAGNADSGGRAGGRARPGGRRG